MQTIDRFLLGDTNFGIDRAKSRFGFEAAADGRVLLTIEVRGSPQVHDEVTADENSAWSWTLYPPYFYLRDFPVAGNNDCAITLKEEDSEDFDLALYLLEHFEVLAGTKIVVSENRLEIAGRFDLMGKPCDFKIDWTR